MNEERTTCIYCFNKIFADFCTVLKALTSDYTNPKIMNVLSTAMAVNNKINVTLLINKFGPLLDLIGSFIDKVETSNRNIEDTLQEILQQKNIDSLFQILKMIIDVLDANRDNIIILLNNKDEILNFISCVLAADTKDLLLLYKIILNGRNCYSRYKRIENS